MGSNPSDVFFSVLNRTVNKEEITRFHNIFCHKSSLFDTIFIKFMVITGRVTIFGKLTYSQYYGLSSNPAGGHHMVHKIGKHHKSKISSEVALGVKKLLKSVICPYPAGPKRYVNFIKVR